MITVGLLLAVAAVAFATWWACRYFLPRSRHAGGGEGALTVAYLVDQVDAETSGGRHRLREPRTAQLRGDLADALAVEETRVLPRTAAPAFVGFATAPSDDLLRCVLDGLRRL